MRDSPVGVVAGPTPAIAGQARRVAGVERLVELPAHADELGEVLDAALRLDRCARPRARRGSRCGRASPRPCAPRRSTAARSNSSMSSSRSRTPPSALPVTPAAAAVARARRGTEALRPARTPRPWLTRRVADAALRRVDDALPAHLVVGVHERAQVRERVLHLATVVELQRRRRRGTARRRAPAPLRRRGSARWCGRRRRRRRTAVPSVSVSRVHLVHHERCLVVLVLGLVPGEQLAADLLGPEVLRAGGPRCWR